MRGTWADNNHLASGQRVRFVTTSARVLSAAPVRVNEDHEPGWLRSAPRAVLCTPANTIENAIGRRNCRTVHKTLSALLVLIGTNWY